MSAGNIEILQDVDELAALTVTIRDENGVSNIVIPTLHVAGMIRIEREGNSVTSVEIQSDRYEGAIETSIIQHPGWEDEE